MQTSINGNNGLDAEPPLLPSSGESLYNALMCDVDRELTTDQLTLLNGKYKDESRSSAIGRSQRYSQAFDCYRTRLSSLVRRMDRILCKYRYGAFASLEIEAKQQEKSQLLDMEKVFESNNIDDVV